MIGLVANQSDVRSTLDLIERADALGIPAAWLIMASTHPDSLTTLAAAAGRTQRIQLGTAIVTIWPRHPLLLANQALVVEALAPGRLRLGVGPGGAGVATIYGAEYTRPLGRLREYIQVLKTVFSQGEVQFDGRYYRAHAKFAHALSVPVLASALQRGSFALAGEIADGALTWVSPATYLRDVGLPALREGAQKAGRSTPPLIAHVPVAVHAKGAEVYAAVRTQFAFYPRAPYYQAMFAAAGFPEAGQGQWSDRMIEAVVVYGDAALVRQQLDAMLALGISELMAHPVLVGDDPAASLTRTLETIAACA